MAMHSSILAWRIPWIEKPGGCFFDEPADVGNLISDSSAVSKSSLNIWKLSVHVLLKPRLENLEPLLLLEMREIVY